MKTVLSKKQQEVLTYIRNGGNVFYEIIDSCWVREDTFEHITSTINALQKKACVNIIGDGMYHRLDYSIY